MLRVEKISKSYGSQEAVRQVSLDLKPGQILGLLGESGSGKSTLLRLIAGLEEPDQGHIFFRDQPFPSFSRQLIPGHPQIRMIHQDSSLLPRHRIYENLHIELRSYSEKYQKIRIKELSEICQLENLLNRYPHELSGGQKQRAALAKALALEPAVLLLDEPFSHLDSHLKPQIRTEIMQIIRKNGTTAILVSHDAHDALALSDRIAVMYQGEILQEGSPQKIYTNPHNPYVAAFLGLANLVNASTLARICSKPLPHKQGCIRPEDIRIAHSQEDSFEAKVIQIQFMGHFLQISVQLDQGEILHFYAPKSDFFDLHQTILLKINPEDIYFFESDHC
ncbi:MAG: ABC transporter ATP-binding protein [Microscillaceae bacterium]|nr:ABC transporter ATP-binding protein [Microscillaceae bacterium]